MLEAHTKPIRSAIGKQRNSCSYCSRWMDWVVVLHRLADQGRRGSCMVVNKLFQLHDDVSLAMRARLFPHHKCLEKASYTTELMELLHQSAAYSMQQESLQHPQSCFLVFIPLQRTQTSPTLLFLYFGSAVYQPQPAALLIDLTDTETQTRAHRYTLWSRSPIPLERLEFALHAGTCSPHPSQPLQRLILGNRKPSRLVNSHGRQRRKPEHRRIRVVPVRRSHAIWTSGFVTVCVIRHLLSRLLISLGIIQYYGERECVSSKGDREEKLGGSGGLMNAFQRRSGSVSPLNGRYGRRELRTLGRPGINNTSLPQHVNHREQCEGFAETPLRRAQTLPVVEAVLVSGVKYIVCALYWPLQQCNKLCRPPVF
ncbi:hypothetical protein Q8A73_010989 [Channa argus]|nr:hypothetical protein Q8A73_010989 [Channa argus]